MASEHTGHRQRMRERYLQQGLKNFAPHEVLELILFFAIPQKNVNPIAHGLMDRFGTLHAVLEAPAEELMKVEGVGEYAAALLSLFAQVAGRMEESREGSLVKLNNVNEAATHCLRLLKAQKNENFYAICLNGQMEVIRDVLIAQGTLSEVQAYPRLVVEAALRHNAHAVLLCHNHPGGQLAPSQADIESTRLIESLLTGIGVVLVDHLIVSGQNTLSMSAYGFLERTRTAVQAQAASSAGQVRIAHGMNKRKKEKE